MKAVCVALMSVLLPAAGLTAAPADYAKVIGTWELELQVEGQYYYLSMTLQEKDGALSGTVTEKSGFFTDSPLAEVTYENGVLVTLAAVPSPPDGSILSWWISLNVGDDSAEGTISNSDIGITAAISGKRTIK